MATSENLATSLYFKDDWPSVSSLVTNKQIRVNVATNPNAVARPAFGLLIISTVFVVIVETTMAPTLLQAGIYHSILHLSILLHLAYHSQPGWISHMLWTVNVSYDLPFARII